MEVSSEKQLTGSQLIKTVVDLTELPQSLMQSELGYIIESSGHVPEALTLDQLRSAMLAYLEALHQEYCEESPSSSVDVEKN